MGKGQCTVESMVKKNKNYWGNKNVFATGCTGLLGSWLVKNNKAPWMIWRK